MGAHDPRAGKPVIRGNNRAPMKSKSHYPLDTAFELFFSVKKAEGMRERTLADYQSHWRYFRDWLSESYDNITLGEITQTVLREYLIYMSNGRTKYDGVDNRRLEGETLSPTTVAIRLRTLKTMFNFWAKEQMIDINPILNLKPPKKDDDEIGAFTDEQLRLLLSMPDTRSYAGYRDKVLMMLLADTGLRINEALRLTTEHIDVKGRCVHLPAAMNKNRKPRIVPISSEVMRHVFDLVNENKAYFDTHHIFVSNYGEPLKADHFRKRLQQYGAKAGIEDQVRVSPHTFRHYFCKMYLLNGGDIFTLQRIVGHADIATTRKYIQMDDESVRIQHAQYTPLSRLGMSKIIKRR
ncbi:tyrosine-type recombinase/integrase [Paenibacillus ehimensis]|uniref:Tyrosine-type recombinase/integrase n=1 Tax=Paenibacillus ehimensis TaxID=79264 RepID=A0ABT8VMJ1_9BACL|nr:tyrosine-type recombinase/integrase [Paenibacillus ehimensis]MDO3682174.1 tyrosine-type recombinase/integrase [Paenibacillus ehimensis]